MFENHGTWWKKFQKKNDNECLKVGNLYWVCIRSNSREKASIGPANN
jgi:hypothetical protein